MKQLLAYTIAAALMLGNGVSRAQETRTNASPDTVADQPKGMMVHTPTNFQWRKGPDALPPGSEMAVLEGDPGKKAYFCVRLRLPDGYQVPPHWHPSHERVTVISGSFYLGHGDKMDRDKMQLLPVGSYVSMEPEMRHYVRAEGETIIQLATIGPWDVNYVNRQDDPRKGQED